MSDPFAALAEIVIAVAAVNAQITADIFMIFIIVSSLKIFVYLSITFINYPIIKEKNYIEFASFYRFLAFIFSSRRNCIGVIPYCSRNFLVISLGEVKPQISEISEIFKSGSCKRL